MTPETRENLDSVLRNTDDLDEVQTALTREKLIRDVMKETGQDRATVTDMHDAMVSMDHEAVLDLTEGEPTTLADALRRYVDSIPGEDGTAADWDVRGDLSTLLAYPWPGDVDTLKS